MEIQEECPIGKEYTVNKHDNEERPELGFIQYRTVMKEEGKFSFTFDRVSYNDEAGSSGEGEVVTLVNTATADAVAKGTLNKNEEIRKEEIIIPVNQEPEPEPAPDILSGKRSKRSLNNP